MKLKRWLLPTLGATLLAACSTAPQVEKSTAPQTASYARKGELLSLEQRTALGERIAGDWWTLFASPPLDKLIREVVANNYDLAAARETLAQAKEAVKAGNGQLLPQASIGAAAGRQKYGAALFGPANFTIPPFTYYEAGPAISWTPDLFGGQHQALDRQRALADYQSHRLDAAYLALTANTVAASLDLAATKAEIAAVRRILEQDKQTLALVNTAYVIGSASEVDVLGAQSRLNADRALLPPLETRLAALRHQLSILAGKAPADWVPPEIGLANFSLPQTLPLSLPSQLVKQRPDILAAEANLHAASAALGVAAAKLYPSLTLSANMLQEALTPAGIFKSTATAWSLAAGLSAPLFDGGTLSAEKRQAQHAYRAALDQYRQTILNAFGEVADALTALAHDDDAVTIMHNNVDTARSTVQLALASYREGATGLLQVQDSQRALATAELGLIRARYQRYLDCVRLFVALGGSPLKTEK
jgi:NodT family efflux transporter outer membrane factor (OMF) lipoprotein